MNDAISNQRLASCHPQLILKVNTAANLLAMQGIYFRVAQGLRTYAEQAAIPHANTNAGPGYSWHNFGMAVDCFPFLHGSTGALEMNDHTAAVFQSMVAALKAQGLAWGGDWHSLKDYPHFQLAEVPVTPTDADRKAFSGGLHAVWALYSQSVPVPVPLPISQPAT